MHKQNKEVLLLEQGSRANPAEKRCGWQKYQIRQDMCLLIQNTDSGEISLQIEHGNGQTPLQFLYCLSGKARIYSKYKDGFRTYTDLDHGQYSINYIYEPCNIQAIQINYPFKLISLLINPRSFIQPYHEIRKIYKKVNSDIQNNAHEKYTFHYQSTVSFRIKIILDQIMNCHEYRNELKKIFIEYKAMELIYNQISIFFPSDIEKYKKISLYEMKAAHDAYDILMHDFISPPCLTDLSKKVGLSRARLNEIFRILHNDTVFGIFRDKRLECAKRMLEEGKKNMAEIAYECGFSTPSHFSRCFSDKYGIQPKRYQNNIATTSYQS